MVHYHFLITLINGFSFKKAITAINEEIALEVLWDILGLCGYYECDIYSCELIATDIDWE